jgi:hypothetical protein
MIVNKVELTTKLTYKKLLIFRRYQMDDKNIKCQFQWQENHESKFPIYGFLLDKENLFLDWNP